MQKVQGDTSDLWDQTRSGKVCDHVTGKWASPSSICVDGGDGFSDNLSSYSSAASTLLYTLNKVSLGASRK
jgi:hypothetical protein